jgi:hypothetical protein
VDLVLALSPSGKCMIVLLFTGVAAPIAGLLFRRVSGGWESVGKGPFAIEQQPEAPIGVDAEATRLLAPTNDAPSAGDRQREELRAEVRQLVVSRNERRMRKGLQPLDVEAEAERQLADFIGSP